MELPTLEQLGVTFDRFEIEFLNERCVRLVGWMGDERMLQLTADPRDQDDLRGLLEVPEVFFCSQAGLERDQIWNIIRSRRNGEQAHGG